MPEIVILLVALVVVIVAVPATVIAVRSRRQPPELSEYDRHLEKFVQTGDWAELDRMTDEIDKDNKDEE